jgi:hypothetical protein
VTDSVLFGKYSLESPHDENAVSQDLARQTRASRLPCTETKVEYQHYFPDVGRHLEMENCE